MSTAAFVKAPARFLSRLTDRDRQLIGFLATARYLSTPQIARLMYPGRRSGAVNDRLRALEGGGPSAFENPLVRRLAFRDLEDAPVTAWSLTPVGYAIAQRAVTEPIRVPAADVRTAFLAHTIALNDLFVGLAAASVEAKVAVAMSALPPDAS